MENKKENKCIVIKIGFPKHNKEAIFKETKKYDMLCEDYFLEINGEIKILSSVFYHIIFYEKKQIAKNNNFGIIISLFNEYLNKPIIILSQYINKENIIIGYECLFNNNKIILDKNSIEFL